MPKNTDKYTQFLAKTAKIKETIYGLTSLLAVCLGLWLHLGQTSAWQALGLVMGSAVGLWLACFFADLLAHSITVADKHERRHAYAHAFDASLGILHAVRMPVFFFGVGRLWDDYGQNGSTIKHYRFGSTAVYLCVVITVSSAKWLVGKYRHHWHTSVDIWTDFTAQARALTFDMFDTLANIDMIPTPQQGQNQPIFGRPLWITIKHTSH